MKKFENFNIFLASNSGPTLLKEVKELYLVPYKVARDRKSVV